MKIKPFLRVPGLFVLRGCFGDAADELRKALTSPVEATDEDAAARKALEECNRILDAFGIEYLVSQDGGWRRRARGNYQYVNRGDTYDVTLIWNCNSGVVIARSWGDLIESLERRGIKFD